jgi:hypothetical protein
VSRKQRLRTFLTAVLSSGAAFVCFGCCSSVAGPTGEAASYSATLAPGEIRFYDVEIPSSTTQINLDFTLDSTTIPLRLRQIDPSCLPLPEDVCQSFYDATMEPRPTGVLRFGNTLQPHGTRSRIVLQNTSSGETASYGITITPFTGGCT